MLQTQVDYWKLQEQRRHDIVQEWLGFGNLDLGYKNLDEVKRHNVVSEELGFRNLDLGYANLAETSRHNKVTEDQGWTDVATRSYSAQVNADLGYRNLSESVRTHQANEAIGRSQAAASMKGAQAAYLQAEVAGDRVTLDRKKTQYYYQYDYPLVKQQRETDWYNAETNRMNAETNQEKLGIQGFSSIIPFLGL